MKTRRVKTAKSNRGKQSIARRARSSSAVNLKEQLDQRTRHLAEARKDLADALERETATSEILTPFLTCWRRYAGSPSEMWLRSSASYAATFIIATAWSQLAAKNFCNDHGPGRSSFSTCDRKTSLTWDICLAP